MLNLLLQYPIFRKCLILIILVDDKNIPSCKTSSLDKLTSFHLNILIHSSASTPVLAQR